MLDVYFDRVASPTAHYLSDRVGKSANVHVGTKNDELKANIEKAEGRVVIVFDIPAIDESQILGENVTGDAFDSLHLLLKIEEDMRTFLERCQKVVTAAALKQDATQVWAFSHDDVACRRLGLPEAPIQNQSRLSCLKSLAKEYGRMGMFFNMCFFHPEKTRLSKDVLKGLKFSMKAYALRYNPPEAKDLSAILESFFMLDNPVMNGGALSLGNGPLEFST